MCHGAPETIDAPSRGPPPAVSQYLDWARCPPQARRTALPVDLKVTTKSAVLLPAVEPAWVGPEMPVIVPPQIVSRRGDPEYAWAPSTVSPFVLKPSDGKANDDEAGIDGHIDEIPPPDGAHVLPAALVTFQVARKS